LWNLYGPTETTIWCTVDQVHSGTGPVLIGRPIQNMKTYVLDPVGNPVPIGVSGELYVGGVGIGRGYLNRVELNKERFVRLAVAGGELLYRTGDMARYMQDGSIECLGRTDNQVKIRGFRVELEEVEAAVGTHPAVAAAAVRCWPDTAGETSLAAYVVLRGGSMPDAQEWRGYLRKMLPDYMIPARFVAIPELPLTPTRKVDRKALPEPEVARALDRYTEPRTRTEKKLADTWRKLLGVHDVGLDDDFFALGGHSLLIAKLVRQIEIGFGYRISMATIFQAPTIREMAALLRDTSAHLELPQVIKIQPKGSLPPLFWLDAGPFFRPLSEALGSDQPFLGLSLDPDEETALGHDFEISEVATLFHRKLKNAQPEGPYFIGGFCSWGIVAYALASRLIAEGEDVGLVVMVDAAHPSLLRRYSGLRIELSKVRWHLAEAFRLTRAEGLSYLIRRARGALGRYRHTVANTAARTAEPHFRAALHRAWERYEPAAYMGSVALFQPSGRPAILNCFPDWQPLIRGQFGCVDTPGDHLTMFDQPNVSLLAAEMNHWLSNSRTALPSKWRAAG
jgi:thioesterase domain-containing protein